MPQPLLSSFHLPFPRGPLHPGLQLSSRLEYTPPCCSAANQNVNSIFKLKSLFSLSNFGIWELHLSLLSFPPQRPFNYHVLILHLLHIIYIHFCPLHSHSHECLRDCESLLTLLLTPSHFQSFSLLSE